MRAADGSAGFTCDVASRGKHRHGVAFENLIPGKKLPGKTWDSSRHDRIAMERSEQEAEWMRLWEKRQRRGADLQSGQNDPMKASVRMAEAGGVMMSPPVVTFTQRGGGKGRRPPPTRP